MFLGITGFEIRYQLKNPVFWVAVAFVAGGGVLIYFGLPGRRAVAGPAPAAPVTPETDEATA